MPLLIIAAIVIAFLAVAFALLNNQIVTVNFLFSQVQFSLALLLLSALAIGIVIGLLVLLPNLIKRGWKVSRAQKTSSALEAQLQEREQALSSRDKNTDRLRQSHRNLLQALGMLDTNTGLISADALPKTLGALIKQMQLQPDNPQFNAIGLLVVEAHRQSPLGEAQPTEMQNTQLDQAIARIIQQNVTIDTWLYCDSRHPDGARFMCVISGTDKTGLRQYGEVLKESLTDDPVKLPDGTVVSLDVKVGGCIADRDHPTSQSQLIIDKANQALESTEKRSGLTMLTGSSNIKIVSVTDR